MIQKLTPEQDLRRFVDPTDAEIEAMWKEVIARQGAAAHIDFIPVETIVCFGLGLNTPPSPSGKVNVKVANRFTQQAAALFGRTPKSLQSKHSNLEDRAGRNGGRRTDPTVGDLFARNPQHYAEVYERTIEGARAVGIDAEVLGDFLGAGSGQLRVVVNAARLSDRQWEEIAESATTVTALEDPGSIETMANRVTAVRIGQQRFSRFVLERSNYSCVFCGLSPHRVGLPSARMLVAGHIKPWRHATSGERLSAANGFAACPTHDAVFEAHFMTVSTDGQIVYSSQLRQAVDSDPAWRAAFSNVGSHVQLSPTAVADSRAMLQWHRQNIPSAVESRLKSRLDAAL